VSNSSHSRWLPFTLFLVGSYALAIATAITVSVTWIEGVMWLGAVALAAWLSLILWGFFRFRARALWAVLGVLALNPVTIFLGGVTYTCAVNGACL